MMRSEIDVLLRAKLFAHSDLLGAGSSAPAVGGLYGWWFHHRALRAISDDAPALDVWRLGYVGIAPRRPSMTGKSRSTLKSRLRQHCRGPIASSTLRRSLAALLRDKLSLHVKRNAAGRLVLVGDGEAALSAWMAMHARVNWVEHDAPWDLEDAMLRGGIPLALNIHGRGDLASQLLRLRRDLRG